MYTSSVFERRDIQDRLRETKIRLAIAERNRAEAARKLPDGAGPGSDRGADQYAGDRDESEGEQPDCENEGQV